MESTNDNTGKANLLDRVLQSQQSETLEHFEALETVNELLKLISSKEADVLRRRFGLGTNDAETLEVIGQSYKVTRERVRQIQHWAIKHLKQLPATAQHLHGLTLALQQLLESRGGLMIEPELFERLQGTGEHTRQRQEAVRFILEQLLDDRVERVEVEAYKPYWKLKFANLSLLEPTIEATRAVLETAGKPLSQAEVLKRLGQTELLRSNGEQLNEAAVLGYISVATTVERNPFGELGLRTWGTIVPKRMHDKILLVMRKHGKPMHFQEISQRINEIGFDHRQAYPPTVHNELILNNEYVLVGRGIYALREWGYKPGVVADVLADILRQAGQPLTRDELVTKVLEQRMVKKNTIALALTNKAKFRRLADGRFTLAESTTTPTPSAPH